MMNDRKRIERTLSTPIRNLASCIRQVDVRPKLDRKTNATIFYDQVNSEFEPSTDEIDGKELNT